MHICVSRHIDADGNLCIYSIVFCRERFQTLDFYARQSDQRKLKMQEKGIKCYLWLSFLWKHQNSSLPWGLCVYYTCQSFSRVQLFASPRTVARQASLSMEFSRQKYWSELPFPSPGDLPNPGIKPRSPALQADSLPSEPPRKPEQVIKSLQTPEISFIIWG